MTDEEYLFHATNRERKSVARSARNRRGHTGKGGKVRLPSDYKTRKEIEKMNGECMTFNLRKPMSWDDFKALPDDLKKEYLEWMRATFGVSIQDISDMFMVHFTTIGKLSKRLGIKKISKNHVKDLDGFFTWCRGDGLNRGVCEIEEPAEEAVEEVPVVKAVLDDPIVPFIVPFEEVNPHIEEKPAIRATPNTGSMVFEGVTEDILTAVNTLLGGARVHLNIVWDVLED